MYRVHSAADQLVNAVVLSFWGAAIENHLGPTTLVCFSDCRQEENTYILSLLTSTSSERLLICQVAFGWSQRTQVYIHKTCECPCALLMDYRQTAKWAESLLKFMWPVNHFHCIDVYIHTYKHTYIHTYMHTYTHAKELRQFRADIHTYVHTGSSILRPSFTHMPVTHASVPGCSAPNALLLPATASQSKGSALAALA